MKKTGTVTALGRSPKGKQTITIDGQVYYPGRTSVEGLGAGDLIEFDSSSFGERGDLWGLNKWKLIEGAAKYPKPSLPSQPTPAVLPREGQYAPTTGITEGERAFCSNICAHAIDKGLVNDGADLGKWAVWAVSAIRDAAKPIFSDDIP